MKTHILEIKRKYTGWFHKANLFSQSIGRKHNDYISVALDTEIERETGTKRVNILVQLQFYFQNLRPKKQKLLAHTSYHLLSCMTIIKLPKPSHICKNTMEALFSGQQSILPNTAKEIANVNVLGTKESVLHVINTCP